MLKPSCVLTDLPPSVDLETVAVLKALARANRALAELKGRAASVWWDWSGCGAAARKTWFLKDLGSIAWRERV